MNEQMTNVILMAKEMTLTFSRLAKAVEHVNSATLGMMCLLRAYELEYGELSKEVIEKHGQRIAEEFNAIQPSELPKPGDLKESPKNG